MLDRHAQEKKQFRQLFEQQGLDRFEERFQVPVTPVMSAVFSVIARLKRVSGRDY